MAFVYEVVQEKDYDFFESMELQNCWGTDLKDLVPESTTWAYDRSKNAFYVDIGGGMHDVPLIHRLWWDGHIISVEVGGGIEYGDTDVVVWVVNKITIPKAIWEQRDLVCGMINDALSVHCDGEEEEDVDSITVKMESASVEQERE